MAQSISAARQAAPAQPSPSRTPAGKKYSGDTVKRTQKSIHEEAAGSRRPPSALGEARGAPSERGLANEVFCRFDILQVGVTLLFCTEEKQQPRSLSLATSPTGGLVGTLRGITASGPGFGSSRQLPCVFETSKSIPLSRETELVRIHVRLLLRGTGSRDGQRLPPENLPPDKIPSFIVQESSGDILPYANEDTEMLDCRISPYYTAGTQVVWPGRDIRASSSDSWFTCTITHTGGKYTMTAFLVRDQEEKENPNPRQFLPGIGEQFHFSAPLLVHSSPACCRSGLARDVWLPCTFSTDHPAEVSVQWVLQQKGGHRKRLLAYSGASRRGEGLAPRAEMVLEEIPKGNASLLLRNIEVRDEGTYSCLVSVASLTLEQMIQLQIEEKPTVTINVNSLSLVEGEQHELVCTVRHYYPHDIHVQWLREPKDSWKVPDVVKNVLSSSHRQSSNGTYSFSRYFLLTASLKDDGHRYTCWVDHASLPSPVRRSVAVEVREATSTAWLLLLLGLAGSLLVALWYLHKVRSTVK
ncbi:PREDICTED: tapasin-related protein-like, partial [Calidris pugnax]|uniref:tapasin-related protein-like n=1 Tax=Calidris pugnax TaxID=198806 RepID=UPI00071D9985